jgi:hypothetical protein
MRGLPDGGLHVRGDRHARGAVQPMWPGGLPVGELVCAAAGADAGDVAGSKRS